MTRKRARKILMSIGRKKMDEGKITEESAFHAGEMKASELWLREVNHA